MFTVLKMLTLHCIISNRIEHCGHESWSVVGYRPLQEVLCKTGTAEAHLLCVPSVEHDSEHLVALPLSRGAPAYPSGCSLFVRIVHVVLQSRQLEGVHIDDAAILKYHIRSYPSDQITLSNFHSLISLIAKSQLDDAVSTPTVTCSGLLYHIVHEQRSTAADKSPESFDIADSTFAVRSTEYLHLADVVRYRIAHVMDYLATT